MKKYGAPSIACSTTARHVDLLPMIFIYGVVYCDCEMCEVHRSAFVAVSVSAHAFISFLVVCAGSADLLMSCVHGSLMHHLIIVWYLM